MRSPAPSGPVLGALDRVLIVDDSGYARLRIRRFLTAEGPWTVDEASDGDEALERFARARPGLVLIDQIMRGREGLEVARLLLERDPKANIVMLTSVSDPWFRERALGAGVRKVLGKDDLEALLPILREPSSV